MTYRKPSSCPIVTQALPRFGGLLRHPQIQRLQLDSDLTDGWRVGAQLAQLLPIDEGLKYQLQGLTSVEQLLEEMDNILVELSGESDQTGR